MTYRNNGKQLLHFDKGSNMLTHIADCRDAEAAHMLATFANQPKGADGGPFDYMAEADKTCSIVFNPQFVDRDAIMGLLDRVIEDANRMNVVKKLFFRGRTPSEVGTSTPSDNDSMGPLLKGCTNEEVNIIHGIVGVITEAGEMAELLKAFFEGTPFDRVHLIEEAGDVEWYQVRILRGIGATLHMRDKTNIDKLHGRHGASFDVFRDANRNLAAERIGLEQSAAPLFDLQDAGPQDVVKIEDAIMPELKRPHSGDTSDMVDRIAEIAKGPRVRNDPPLPPGITPAVTSGVPRTPAGDCEGMDC